MAKTKTITVNSASPTAIIVAGTACRIVRVMENRAVAGWPTTDYLIFKPTSTDVPVRIPASASYTFTAGISFFPAGATIGFIQTVTGTTTFDQDEDQG